MDLRCFIAIELPHELRERIGNALAPIAQAREVKWVRPENIHITLKFLGSVPEQKIEDITAGIRRAAKDSGQITVRVRGAGAFPNTRRPSVLWLGLDASGALIELHARLEREMEQLGFSPEGREFSAHLTVGRVRKGSRATKRTMAGFEALEGEEFGSFVAASIALIKSELRPKGPKYTVIHSSKLGK